MKDKWDFIFCFSTYTQNPPGTGLTTLIFSASTAMLRSQFNQRLVQNPKEEEKYLKYINFSDSLQELSTSWHKKKDLEQNRDTKATVLEPAAYAHGKVREVQKGS